jgi:glycine/D-amino acid oxidase-like deaminating enzyme
VDTGRILIVGGGITGLSLATAVHRLGRAAELVERRASWPLEGAAITLHANGGPGDPGPGLGAPQVEGPINDLADQEEPRS